MTELGIFKKRRLIAEARARKQFSEVMSNSADKFGSTHLTAHIRVNKSLDKLLGISGSDLTDIEKTILACTISEVLSLAGE
jgi:hypothetical protein